MVNLKGSLKSYNQEAMFSKKPQHFPPKKTFKDHLQKILSNHEYFCKEGGKAAVYLYNWHSTSKIWIFVAKIYKNPTIIKYCLKSLCLSWHSF